MFEALTDIPKRIARRRFERRLEAFLPDLYRLARGLMDDPADAEDLTHDVCVKAFAALDSAQLPTDAACRAWLRSILMNTFRDRYRRLKRSPDMHEHGDGVPDYSNIVELAPSDVAEPEKHLHYEDFAQAAQDAFTALPPEVRAATVFHLVGGVAYKDIAAITDCPIGTVMSRIARGRHLLRARLQRFVTSPAAMGTRENCS